MERPRRILLGIGGGIAAYKSAELVRRLREAGYEVRCALSRSAASFIPPLTLEVLSGHSVYGQEYLSANGSGEELHITAASWADAICIVPSTAHLIARLALGLADDFLTTTVLASSAPLVLAPAMHEEMWSKEAVQGNIARLRQRGVHLVGPERGALASGDSGMGRMSSPDSIVERLGAIFASGKTLFERTLVVTAGPTREPLDPVRYLGNRSSGKMGFAIAGEAALKGARVVLVAGPVHLETPPGVERHDVTTALEMEAAVHRFAPEADVIVMTAAVADFRPRTRSAEKIKKAGGTLPIDLVPNPDILKGLPAIAPGALRVGFAAETERIEDHALNKLRAKQAHIIVANDVSRGDIGFRADENEVTIYQQDREPVFVSRRSKREVARALLDICVAALDLRSQPQTALPVSAGS